MKKTVLLISAVLCAVSVSAAEKISEKAEIALKNIMTRTSIRAYQKKEVSKQYETLILKAAMAAPSGMDRRPWVFVVIRDQSVKDQLAKNFPNAKMVANAPLAIMVCAYPAKSNLWMCDVSAATQNILLAANALDLGAVWCGIYNANKNDIARKILSLKSDVEPFALVSIGYPVKAQKPKDKWNTSRIIRR